MSIHQREAVIIAAVCIGEVEWSPEADFPWGSGWFHPGREFAAFADYFAPQRSAAGAEERWLSIERLAAAGIAADQLWFGLDPEDRTFIHALVLRAEGRAAWRFGFDPSEDDHG